MFIIKLNNSQILTSFIIKNSLGSHNNKGIKNSESFRRLRCGIMIELLVQNSLDFNMLNDLYNIVKK